MGIFKNKYIGEGVTPGQGIVYKGLIYVSADFPTKAEVQNGWVYGIAENVTDNDSSKTNTGQSFSEHTEIIWNSSAVRWDPFGSLPANNEYIDFNINYDGPLPEGRMAYKDSVPQIGMGGGVIQQVGEEFYLKDKPKNDEGAEIANGVPVYVSGATGNVLEVKVAGALDFNNACGTIALTTQILPSPGNGRCTTNGAVNGSDDEPIDTSAFTEGETIWLSTTKGQYVNERPLAPACIVKIGIVTRSHITQGAIDVKIEIERDLVARDITREPTGFTAPENIAVNGNVGLRTITLTGVVNGYYKGIPISELTDGWISPAHPDDQNSYFLVFRGNYSAGNPLFEWIELANLKFYDLLICYTFYDSINSKRIYLRECHGIMPWQSHEQEHETTGTYLTDGGVFDNFVPLSTVPAERRPSISTTELKDEDLRSVLPSLAAGGPYTQMFLTGGGGNPNDGVVNFTLNAADIPLLNGDNPFWNEFNGTDWVQTLLANNNYTSSWAIAIPVASDSDSQLYRFGMLQGQDFSATLTAQRALDPNEVNLGNLKVLTPESFIFGQIILSYLGGNWSIVEIIPISGNRVSQIKGGSGGGVTKFLNLDDVIPNSYVGEQGKVVKVNAAETGLEFAIDETGSTAKTEILPINSGGQVDFVITETPISDDAFQLIIDGQTRSSPNDYLRAGKNVTWQNPEIISAASNSSAAATFKSSFNLDYADGNKAATLIGSPTRFNENLDLQGAVIAGVKYSAVSNASFTQTFTIRMQIIPNYSIAPLTDQYFISINTGLTTNNLIELYHATSGNLFINIFDDLGSAIISTSNGVFSPKSGIKYEIELNCDITTGETRLFIQGVQTSITYTQTGTRGPTCDTLIIGNSRFEGATPDFMLDNFILFKDVQHTTDYVPDDKIILPQNYILKTTQELKAKYKY